ncbi:hypothetical protein EI94DRAFT_284489 [Lactarius quietus]|nr:hypothetical protein EI94DRAFT_284489 [Lactarius quietus]
MSIHFDRLGPRVLRCSVCIWRRLPGPCLLLGCVRRVQRQSGPISHPLVLLPIENLLTDFQAFPPADFLLVGVEISVFSCSIGNATNFKLSVTALDWGSSQQKYRRSCEELRKHRHHRHARN